MLIEVIAVIGDRAEGMLIYASVEIKLGVISGVL